MVTEIYINPGGGISSSELSVDTRSMVFTGAISSFHRRPSFWLDHFPYWTGPFLVSLTFASMALGLRGSRPRRRRLARRPGMAAGLAVTLALGVVLVQCLQSSVATGAPLVNLMQSWQAYWAFPWISLPRLAGGTVAVWWLALALSGRWSGVRSSAERLGVAFGWCWIALAVSGQVGAWCLALNY